MTGGGGGAINQAEAQQLHSHHATVRQCVKIPDGEVPHRLAGLNLQLKN